MVISSIISKKPYTLEKRMAWAFSVKTENINQKTLLLFLAMSSDELCYVDYSVVMPVENHVLNMSDRDIGFAYIGLQRLGLIESCKDNLFDTLLCTNSNGAGF
jgi:hypothetical protein